MRSKCWEQLIWLDPVNYGGIIGKLPEGIESNTLLENVERSNPSEDDDDTVSALSVSMRLNNEKLYRFQPILMMNWSLAEQLPEIAGCRNSFKAIIAGYVNAIYFKTHKNPDRTLLSLTADEKQDIAEFAIDILRDDLSQKLFE